MSFSALTSLESHFSAGPDTGVLTPYGLAEENPGVANARQAQSTALGSPRMATSLIEAAPAPNQRRESESLVRVCVDIILERT